MYKVIKDGETLGYSDTLRFIHITECGSYAQCARADASGVAIDGVAYSLLGTDGLPGTETVGVVEVDGGAVIREQQKTIDGLNAQLEATQAALDDMILG